MKRLLHFSFLLLFLFINFSFAQQDAVIQKLIEIGKTDNKVMHYADYLTNRFGGRVTGSNAHENAAKWIVSEFKKMGVKAELQEAYEVAIGFNRGPWFGKMIKPMEMALEFATPGYTSGTKGVQRGKAVLTPKNIQEILANKEKFKDAWILLDIDREGYARDADSVSSFTKKLIEAGALGTIQKTKAPIRVFDVKRDLSFDDLPVLPDIKMLDTHFDKIKEAITKGEEVILQFDIRNHFRPGPVKVYNVIATLTGSKFPNEYVILGGHLDSFDHATGAVDNASGASVAIEALRMLVKAGAKPKRSVMVQLYAAEERGLIGSTAWVDKNKKLLPKISAVINRDNGTNAVTSLSVPKVMFEDFKKITEPLINLNPKYPFTLTSGNPYRKAGRGGTDTHPFIMNGVPAFGFRTDGTQRYGTTWHTAWDTYDQLVPEYLEHSVTCAAITAYGIANLDHLLPREGAFLPDGIYADLNTNKGRITLALDFEHAPVTVSSFVGLAEGKIKNNAVEEGKPYFTNSLWHRVVPGHVIQAGMPSQPKENYNTEKEIEGPGYSFPNEIYKGLSHNKAGMLGMANAGAHTNGSQFYITLGDRGYLDGNYTLFGWVEDGMEVVNKIVQGDTIKSITITRIGEKANKFKVDDETFKAMVQKAKEDVIEKEEKKKKSEEDFINKKWPKAASLSNGAKYKIVKEGSGNKFAEGTELRVTYKGTFLDGSNPFVSTSENGRPNSLAIPEELIYTIGKSKINPSVDIALGEMKAGEVRTLIVPYSLGYDSGVTYGKTIEGKKRFSIPPYTSLVYQIEVVGIK